MVSQDVVLFDDTVKANIAYGNIEASDKEILEASKLANCHEFIEDLQNKYETLIGENGVKLSGGQKTKNFNCESHFKEKFNYFIR